MSDLKPCGTYHSLECGMCVECPVPVKFYEQDKTNESIVEAWREARRE